MKKDYSVPAPGLAAGRHYVAYRFNLTKPVPPPWCNLTCVCPKIGGCFKIFYSGK